MNDANTAFTLSGTKDLFTISDLWPLLGWSRSKVHCLIKAGELAVVRDGRRVFVTRQSIQDRINRLTK